MLDILFLQKIALAMMAGALLGLERQYSKKQNTIGMRTFALISLLGAVAVAVSDDLVGNSSLIVLGFALAAVFSAGYYFAKFREAKGFTTSMAIIISYVLGMMAGYSLFLETVFLSIIVAVILFSKETLHKLVRHLTEREVGDLLEFLVLLGIIYPVLPREINIYGIAIPVFTIWVLVVLMSLINFAAFISARRVSSRHEMEAISFLGGLVSSTATLISLLDIYKKNKKTLPVMGGGFLLLNAASFVRNLALVLIVAPAAGAIVAIPVLICAGIMSLFGLRMANSSEKTGRIKIESPFNVKRGVKLAAAIAVMFVLLDFVKFSGAKFFVIFAFLGGIAETSATLISLMSMHTEAVITAEILAAAVMTAQMGGYAGNVLVCRAYGGKKVLEKTMVPFALSITSAFITLAILIFI